jgi:hypothetical protein
MNRRGFLVVGPESSGTKLTAELLRRAGCRSMAIVGGDDGPELPLDGHHPLIRRSFPHGGDWPSFTDLVRLLAVDEVHVVVTARDWVAMVSSQVNRNLAADRPTALDNVRRAYREIFSGICALDLPFILSSYETLTSHPRAAAGLLAALGLPTASVETYKGNEKWYREGPAATGPPPGAWTAGQA